MENKIVFKDNQVIYKYFDNKTNTLTLNDDNTYYFEFENYVPQTLNLIVNSNARVIENYKDVNSFTYNIKINENASLVRLAILVDNPNINITKVIDNFGYYESMQIDLNNKDIVSEETINMLKENASSLIIDGIYAFNKAHKKYITKINHEVKETTSKASIFAINDDEANVSIYTDAFIKNKASQVNTSQEGRIINLTNKAYGIVLPNLHIDENDVQASHSCSVGSLNQDHMYYLKSRGFSETEASKMLIKGYFNPILKHITSVELKEKLEEIINERIG